jgi:hypothetical protein
VYDALGPDGHLRCKATGFRMVRDSWLGQDFLGWHCRNLVVTVGNYLLEMVLHLEPLLGPILRRSGKL